MSILVFLIPAFLACIILTGIHTYLGLHVVRRGIIFLDIALAQIAALGITLAMAAGYEPESQPAYFFALGATLAGALLFAMIRDRKGSLEALIGITFVVTSSLSLLIADRLPHGGEHLKFILNGNILWVGKDELVKTAVIYALIGTAHFFLRKKLIPISESSGEKHSFWLDLFFYGSFGLVITSSVQIAGVLLVFCFLIVPAVISQLFFSTWKGQTLAGWVLGLVGSVIGLVLSYKLDAPTGAMLVSVFGGMTLAAFLLTKVFPTTKSRPLRSR